jgi:aryl-alcohol dehydrogenase-like predicted oxidoreductase
MQQRTLGRNGPPVGAIGLGTMGMGGSYGPVDEAEAQATIRGALDRGASLIDTADFYGAGAVEELVGRALRGRRAEAVIATKTGMRIGSGGPRPDGRPEAIAAAIDASLKRLDTDHVDLLYLARVDPEVPIEESVGAMGELVAAGKVGRIGLCEASAATLRRAHAVHPVAALQTEFSIWERHVEREILPAIQDCGSTLVAYRPLGSGFLTGEVTVDRLGSDDFRRHDPRLEGANLYRNLTTVSAIQEYAQHKDVTPAQLLLAWVLAHPGTITIPGSKRQAHLYENLAAADVVLSGAEVAELAALVPAATGERYAPALLATIDGQA